MLVFQESFKGVTREFQGCFKEVLVFHGFRGVSRKGGRGFIVPVLNVMLLSKNKEGQTWAFGRSWG